METDYLPSSVVTLACIGERIAGFSAMKEATLHALFVLPDVWGAGIGSALVRRLLSRHAVITLEVFARNDRALAFYERHGFTRQTMGRCPDTGEAQWSMRYERTEV